MPTINISSSRAARAAWHKQLLTSNLAERLENGSLLEFPKSVLQATKEFVLKKKLGSNPEECDRQLAELIREHVEREHGSPEIAILACTLEFSPFTAIAYLVSLRGDGQPNPSYSKYLRCLIVANTIIDRYVSEEEAQIAKSLLHIRLGYTEPLLIFRNMIATLATVPASQMLPSQYINKLLTFCQIPQSYDMYLRMLQGRCHYATLYRTVSWVNEYLLPQQCQLAYEVLQGQIPQLELWNGWKPDETLLQKWEDYRFTPEQLMKLRPVLRLQLPDVTKSGKPTYKEAQPASFDTVAVGPPDLALPDRLVLLDRLEQLLAAALHVGPGAIDMFIHMCVDSPASADTLDFSEKVIRSGSNHCCNAAIALVNGVVREATVSARMMTLTSTLPMLQMQPVLRETFADNVINVVESTMATAQEAYRAQLSSSLGDAFCYKIYAYGQAILTAEWLHDFVEPHFLQGLQRFPPEEVFRSVMDRLQNPINESAEQAMKAYLSASLGGTGTEEEIAALKAVVDAEQEFWITHQDVERNRILTSIRKLPYLQDKDFLRACRRQILVEDIVLLRDLLGLIERDSHVSCVDILRILARRLELPMAVHEVWISLILLMIQQRAEELLLWTCDNLTVQSWFRWVADMQIVFTGRHDRSVVMSNLGFTVTRQNWWGQLEGPYRVGVEYLDRLQRQQNGGVASMKWLYLEEIPNLRALLNVIVGQRKLDYDHRWILSFFEPSRDSITTLCNCLAAHEQSSPQGRYGIRTILERFYMVEGWPDSAAQAYMMAWKRSNDLTEEDHKALNLLSELMSIKPSLNPHGLGVIKSKMLQEYDKVIEMAREVEGLRIQLSRRDNTRTNALVARLGMQGTRPYIDPDIPEALSDSIECVGPREYELCFPLTHLQGHDRKTRGIGSDLFPILTVRVDMSNNAKEYGYCVHLVPHDTVHEAGKGLQVQVKQQANHTYWRPRSSRYKKPASRMCTASFNLFTHALAQRLHRHFLDQDITLQSIYDVVNETIKRPGAECTACGNALTGLWKPTICTKDACIREMSRSGLLVRAYGLLIDAPVLDFLLCCLYAAAKDNSGLQLLTTDCPFEKTRLVTILDSFPALPADDKATPFDLLNKIRATNYLSSEREQLLAWMSKWFRGCMLSAPQGKRLSIMSDVEQFLLFNSTPECEKAFNDCVQATASTTNSTRSRNTGDVVFHGSQTARMWKVLTEGLRNMSNTRYMAHGAVNGPGIYLADEPATSFGYSGAFSATWANSAFRGKKVLLGCELVEPNPNAPLPAGTKKPPAGTHIVTDESRVLVRYVFICPPTYAMPPARHIDTAMRSAFSQLRAGPSV